MKPKVLTMLMMVLSVIVVSQFWVGLSNLQQKMAPLETSFRPNIILILTDDQRYDTLPYMPYLNGTLAEESYTFTNAFVTTPLCCPSRATLLTGQSAYNHGVTTNYRPTGGATVFEDAYTLPRALKANGYRTGLFGKYMNDYDFLQAQLGVPYIPPGWSEWFAFHERISNGVANSWYYDYTVNDNGTYVDYGQSPAAYSTDLLTQKAVEFIETTDENKPFFLYLSYWAPHTAPIPAARHAGAYADEPPWLPPSYNEADVSDKPDYISGAPPIDSAEM